MLKAEIVPSLLLIIMGLIDCITTVIGILYSGASELNPLMATIVNSNMGGFLVVKVASTMLIALTYLFARRMIMQTKDKTSRTFKYSYNGIRIAYVGMLAFLVIVVANNLLILLA